MNDPFGYFHLTNLFKYFKYQTETNHLKFHSVKFWDAVPGHGCVVRLFYHLKDEDVQRPNDLVGIFGTFDARIEHDMKAQMCQIS